MTIRDRSISNNRSNSIGRLAGNTKILFIWIDNMLSETNPIQARPILTLLILVQPVIKQSLREPVAAPAIKAKWPPTPIRPSPPIQNCSAIQDCARGQEVTTSGRPLLPEFRDHPAHHHFITPQKQFTYFLRHTP